MILATDEGTGGIVGVSFMLDYEAEGGSVQQVATRASHRHQGIARAMLVRAFQVFWDQGERVVGLNTDSRTGALGMYEKVGMHVKQRLHEGADLLVHPEGASPWVRAEPDHTLALIPGRLEGADQHGAGDAPVAVGRLVSRPVATTHPRLHSRA